MRYKTCSPSVLPQARLPSWVQVRLFLAVTLLLLTTVACTQMPAGIVEAPAAAPPVASARPMPVQHSPRSAQHAIRFERLLLNSGISDNAVLAIHQDAQGFMWFGTRYGLNRYDGYSFTVYKPDPENPNALTNAVVTAIQESTDGSLWIGTLTGGLNRFDRQTGLFASYRHDPDDANSPSEDSIWCLHRDRAGVLWIGTVGGGLNAFDPVTQTIARYRQRPDDLTSLSNDFVRAILEDSRGALWVGTNNGLNRLDRATDQFTRYRHDPDDLWSLGDDLVDEIYQDREGVLWIGTGRGLSKYDPVADRFINYTHDPDDPGSPAPGTVVTIGEDQAGRLWLGTSRSFGGLDRFDRATETFIHFAHSDNDLRSLSSNDVRSIYLDRGGVLWIGTYGGGVNKLNPATEAFLHYQRDPGSDDTLSHNYVTSLYSEEDDVLWIGTRGGGLNRLDRRTDTFTTYRHDAADPGSLSDDNVWSIYRDSRGTLWVGTEMGGLNRFDAGSQTFVHYQHNPGDPGSLGDDFVRTIYEDRDGILWLGTYNGLDRLDPATGQFSHHVADPARPDSLSDDVVLCIYQGLDGDLWIGTERGGLNHFDLDSGSFAVYAHDPNDPRSLGDNGITAIIQDQAGVLWVGTSVGLDRFDPGTLSFDHYGEQEGLADTSIHGILVDDDGNLWLSTNRGLSRFDPRTETFKNYDASDGLQNEGYNNGAYHRADSGELFFGGALGFEVFRPERIWENPHAPPIAVTAFSLFGEQMQADLTHGERIELSYRDNFVSFDYAALDYAAPAKNQYAYAMEGVDRDWVDAGTRRHADYPNLRWGDYVFRVKGSNNDDVWNEQGTEIHIAITPPFWATWWFRATGVLAVVGCVAGVYVWRVKTVEARSRALQMQVEARTREIEKRTRELEALNAIAAVVSRSLDRQELLCNALEKTLEVTGLDAGGIYLLEQGSQTLTLTAHYGLDPEFVAEVDHLAVGEGFSGRVVQSGEPLVVRDLANDDRLTREIVRQSGYRSIATFPLVSRAKVLGTLTAITRGEHELSAQDVSLLTAIGQQIGVAVENVRLFEEAQIRAEELVVLNELGQALTAQLDVDQVLDEAYRGASRLLDTTNFYIALHDPEEDTVTFALDVIGGEVHRHYAARKAGRGLTEYIIRSRAPLLVREHLVECREQLGIEQMGPSALSWLGVPLMIGDQVLGVMAVQSYTTARAYDEHDRNLLIGIASQAAIAIQNARLFRETGRRTQDLEALYSADEQVYRHLDLDQVLQSLVDVAVDILEADKSSLMVWSEDRERLVVRAARGFSSETVAKMTFASGEGTVGQVAASGQAAVVEDTHADPSVARRITDPENIRSFMHVPIEIEGQVFGVFNADYAEPRAFGEDEMRLFAALAQRAALAVQNAQLYEQAQELAAVEERQRLARDLHDAVTQTLFSASLIAESVPELWAQNPQRGQEMLDKVRQLSRGALAEMRTLLIELRPTRLLEADLGTLLRQLAQAASGREGIPIQVNVNGACDLPAEVHVAIYRIAQEALNNVVKHAQASEVEVGLYCDDDPLPSARLCIRDDGCGFETSSVSSEHLGLGIMRERATAVGAELVIESEIGRGCEVILNWLADGGKGNAE